MKFFLPLLVLFIGCSNSENFRNWNEIRESKSIRIATVNSSTTYFQGKDGELEGFEYELAQQFAKDHELEVEFIVKDSIKDLLLALQNSEADIAASGLSITDNRLNTFSFSPNYFNSHQVVSCKQNVNIQKLEDLTKLKIILPKDTSYAENLHTLKKSFPLLSWEEIDDATSELVLQTIWKEQDLCTVVDEHLLNLHRRYMPELHNVYTFKGVDQISWATKRKNRTLQAKVNHWFQQKQTKELIVDLKRKYFDFIDFDAYNLKVFNTRILSRLPKYIDLFKQAAKEFQFDWELLAAVGYQESYWDPNAISPTGVRGLMMLTQKTANEMGIKNRLSPKQSIIGGAKYLRSLVDKLPEYVDEEDKLWFALASYNVGYYHLRDAMALSIWRNQNPTKWHSVQKVLPLLSHKKYYTLLPYGHARGLEPVIYVKRIQDYYDILKKFEFKNAPVKVYQ